MHIKISKSSFSEALNSVQTVANSKASLPVLQNVKIVVRDGKAEFLCTDIETTLQTETSCEVLEDGETTIPVKPLASAVSKVIDGEIDFEVDEKDRAKLKAGSSRFRFNGIPAKEFPSLPEGDSGIGATVPAATLREMLRKTAFAMSVDETRRVLNGLFLDFSKGNGSALAVATDGRRLSLLECNLSIPEGFAEKFILPRKAVDVLIKRLPKDGDCTIKSVGSQVCFTTDRMKLTTKVVDGEYPNYSQVIPSAKLTPIQIDRAELVGALDRISVFTATDGGSVQFAFGDGRVVLNSKDTEFGSSKDEVPVKYTGESITINFNPQYIYDCLNALDDDEIDFCLVDGTNPAMIRRTGQADYTYVVMPLRTA